MEISEQLYGLQVKIKVLDATNDRAGGTAGPIAIQGGLKSVIVRYRLDFDNIEYVSTLHLKLVENSNMKYISTLTDATASTYSGSSISATIETSNKLPSPGIIPFRSPPE